MCKSLKTKGFNPKIEAFYLIGGGENRTLVLGKLHQDHYMLSALKIADIDAEHATKVSLFHFISSLIP